MNIQMKAGNAAAALLGVLVLLQAAPSPAQPGGMTAPRMFGRFTPEVGVWAQYEVTGKGAADASKMRMAIVGREGSSFWYEVWMEDGKSRNVIKMLVKGDPSDRENIERMIIKSGDAQAMEMPRDFVVMGRKMAGYMYESRSGVPDKSDPDITVKELGEREVTVPAGTFRTTQSRIVDGAGKELGTFDVSEKVPPFGVILSMTGSSTMTLLAYGSDAVTAISEEPAPMTGPPGMPGMMPPGKR